MTTIAESFELATDPFGPFSITSGVNDKISRHRLLQAIHFGINTNMSVNARNASVSSESEGSIEGRGA
jgi:hypothetical protein